MNKLIERRLEFLNMEGMGFSLCEIVKALSKKYHKSERMIYYDAETRSTWQPVLTQLFDLDKARLIAVNRYETIYRKAALTYLKADSDTGKTGSLRLMLDTTNNLVNLLGINSVAQAKLNSERVKFIDEQIEFLEKISAWPKSNSKSQARKVTF